MSINLGRLDKLKLARYFSGRVDGWMGGWGVDGWVEGWMKEVTWAGME